MGRFAAAQGYRGIYINLDRSPARRQNVEAQLERLRLTQDYVRLAAVDGRTLTRTGRLNTGIVGCFASHVRLFELAKRAEAIVHVAEDDIVLSEHVAPFIRYGAERGMFEEYDIVFLDLWVDPVAQLIERYHAAFEAATRSEPLDYSRLSVIELTDIRIGATASYVVAPSKVGKVASLLTAEMMRGPTVPIDQYYTRLARSGAIRAGLVVPFLTTIDLDEGAISYTNTMNEQEHRLFLLLRNAFFVDRDLANVVIPGFDDYRRRKSYRGLTEIRNLLARSAGLPVD